MQGEQAERIGVIYLLFILYELRVEMVILQACFNHLSFAFQIVF